MGAPNKVEFGPILQSLLYHMFEKGAPKTATIITGPVEGQRGRLCPGPP